MNSPRDGHVADIMRRTRAQYHYTIRKLKRSNDLLRIKSMARAISEKNSRNLWCEAYKIRRTIQQFQTVLIMYLEVKKYLTCF